MGIVRRAYLYIIRKKMRSILLFLIFFAAGLFCLIGISIKQSTKAEAEKFRKTLTAGLSIDYVGASDIMEESLNEKGERVQEYPASMLRADNISEILAVEGVSGIYSYIQREDAYVDLKLHPGYYTWCLDIADEKIPLENDMTEEDREFFKDDYQSSEAYAHTVGILQVYDSEWHPSFVNGAVKLVEGRHIRTGDVAKVLVSDEVAKTNGLKIGDEVPLRNADPMTGELYGDAHETEIVGIYHINFEQKITEYTCESDILANTFFTTPEFYPWSRYNYQVEYGYTVTAKGSEDILVNTVVFVEDPALLDSVKEKLPAIDSIEWDDYQIETYDENYQTAAAPLLTMMKLSDLLTVISAVGVLLVLFLVLNIWMRSRKREAGIFASIGMKKSEVRLQFMIECCGIAAAAFLASVLLAKPVTDLAGDAMQTMFYSSGDTRGYEVTIERGTSDMYIDLLPPAKGDALAYTVTPKEACFVFLLMAGAAVISVTASSGKILKQEPREILHG